MRYVLAAVLLSAGLFTARADDRDDRAGLGRGTIVVSPVPTTSCPHPDFTEIADAVAAAPFGATIHVCPGLYLKAVLITKTVHIDAETGSYLQPTNFVVGPAEAFTTGHPMPNAAIVIQNAQNVTIDDLTVDAINVPKPANCTSGDLIGIMISNSTGALTHMVVKNVNAGPGSACAAAAILEQSTGPFTASMDILDSSIHDYQKAGIVIEGPLTFVNVKRDFVAGNGPASTIGQIGIQISDGANSSVENNLVSNNFAAGSANIATFAPTPGTAIRNNTSDLGGSEGIVINSDGVPVQNNTVFNNAFDGIDLFGNGDRAENNLVVLTTSTGIGIGGSERAGDGEYD